MHRQLEKLRERLANLAEARARLIAQMSELSSLREQIAEAQLSVRRPRGGWLQ
jgi:hypothetical protein